MSMTKKDFELLADVLARVHPRFDRTKFLDRVAPNLTTLFPPAADG